jgi:hypothetical protein
LIWIPTMAMAAVGAYCIRPMIIRPIRPATIMRAYAIRPYCASLARGYPN